MKKSVLFLAVLISFGALLTSCSRKSGCPSTHVKPVDIENYKAKKSKKYKKYKL